MQFLVITLTFLLTAANPMGSHAVPKPNGKWIRVHTPSFTLISDAHPEVATEAAQILECFRATVEEREPSTATEAFVPTTVIVFEDDKSHRPYKLHPSGEPMSYVGLFAPRPDGNFIGMTIRSDRDPYATVLHEYIHWMLSRNHNQVPLWLNEGMAEFYETFKIKGDKVQIGRPIENHLEWLKYKPMFPLPKLFVVDQQSREYNEAERIGVFYAQSWALYHYMHLGRPDLGPKLATFLRSLNATANATVAWRDAFGTGHDPIEAGLKEYVRENRFPIQEVPVRCPDREQLARAEALPYADAVYILGEYLAHVTPWWKQEVRFHFEAAIRADPRHARAHAALAAFLDDEDRHLEAENLFRKARELAPNDQEVYFRWGSTRVRRFVHAQEGASTLPDSVPAKLLGARDLLTRCLELEPKRAEACVNLGATYLLDPGDVSNGVSALQTARALLPSRMDVAYDLVYLYLRQGNRAAAADLVSGALAHSLRREWLQRGTKLLEEDTVRLYNNAVDRYNDRDDAGALLFLDRLQVGVNDVQMTNNIAAFREKVLARSTRSR